jgi:plastocyanin
MKNIFLLSFMVASFAVSAFAHEAFKLVSAKRKIITEADVLALEKERTAAAAEGTTLTFTQNDIRLLIVTGPEDDMLSYRVLGIRNPTLVVQPGATLRILFVNRDGDMLHDVRFGHVMAEFGLTPEIAETVGSEKLAAHEESAPMQAEEIVIQAREGGAYKYFCSVRGHAKGGMWGNILVGVKPGDDMKMPVKTEHVHSPDEDKMDNMPGMKPGEKKKPDDMSDMPGMSDDEMAGMDHGHAMKMSAVSNVGDPMERESSGTAWAPDSSPVYARMKMTKGGGMWMFMGTAFLRYTQIGSTRDVSVAGKGSKAKVDAPTMFMAMYSHPIGERSQFGFRSMASLDPIIEQGFGYPLLYQSGEQYHGQPLHDRQHPHDLISELAVTFSHKFDDKKSFYLYAGLPGEPAFGPPMYLHRTSGMNNPDAPIGHHWQDATHITFGVVTAGFSFGKGKIEASAFNGTEPNGNRWNFDKPRLNSFSGRFTVNPTKNLSFQISHAYLKNPEPLEPEIRILHKTTASAIYNKRFDGEHNWASTFVWGQNYANGDRTNAFLVESNYDFFKNAVFGRFETVQKSGHDLVLPPPLDHEVFNVQAFSLGYVRDIVQGKGLDVGLGGMFTVGHNPASLMPVYGGTTHAGWQFFMRLRPSKRQ